MKQVYCGFLGGKLSVGNQSFCGHVIEIADDIGLRTVVYQFARDYGFTVVEAGSKNGVCLGVCEDPSGLGCIFAATYTKEKFLDVISRFREFESFYS